MRRIRPLFGDRLVIALEIEVSIRETVFQGVGVARGRGLGERRLKQLDALVSAPRFSACRVSHNCCIRELRFGSVGAARNSSAIRSIGSPASRRMIAPKMRWTFTRVRKISAASWLRPSRRASKASLSYPRAVPSLTKRNRTPI